MTPASLPLPPRQVYVETVLADSPVGFWRFHDLTDCSGHSYTAGAPSGGYPASYGQNGQTIYAAAPYAAYFPTSYLTLGSSAFNLGSTATSWSAAAFASGFTLEIWASLPSGTTMFPTPGSYNYARLMEFGTYTPSNGQTSY